MIPAGELSNKVTFRRRALDANGDRLGGWADQVTLSARRTTVRTRGSEQELQGRIQGLQPVLFTVRLCSAIRGLDNTWSALDVRSGEEFNIVAVEPTKGDERRFVDVLATKDGTSGS